MSQFDGVFVGGFAADNLVLLDYVRQGGNVYLLGGSGGRGSIGPAEIESATWELFLSEFGLSLLPTYRNSGAIPIDPKPHPIFSGVNRLFQDVGQPIVDLDPNDSLGFITSFSGGDGLYAIYDTSFAAHSSYRYDIAAFDPDNDRLTYSLIESPDGMWIDPRSGLIRWSSTADQVGNHDIKILVDDGHGGMAEQEFIVCVHGDPENHAPVIISNPIAVAYADASYQYDVDALDPDNESLTYTLVKSPSGMTIDRSSGSITWDAASVGLSVANVDVTVRVADGRGGVDEQSFAIDVTLQGTGEIRGKVYVDEVGSDSRNVVADSVDDFSNVQGQEVWAYSLSGSQPIGGGIEYALTLRLNEGDIVDFVLNAGANGNEQYDSTVYSAHLEARPMPLQGWTIYLDQNQNGIRDVGEQTEVSDANGDYAFTGLPEGIYYVREELRSGWTQLVPGRRQDAKFFGPLPYLGRNDSPFASVAFDQFYLEDFEDGQFNVPGVTATFARDFGVSAGLRVTTGRAIDNVDEDDGTIDGSGNVGFTFGPIGNPTGGSSQGVRFTFDDVLLGAFPTHAGIVWTDGTPNDTIIFEAFDRNGQRVISTSSPGVGDGGFFGTTGEDRFFGVSFPDGISSFQVYGERLNANSFEVDHLQYGIGTFDSFFKIDLDDGEVVSDVDFVNAMVSNTSNQTPIIVSHSIDHATTNMLYRYEVKSLDPENDRLTYQLTSSPAGMTVHPTRGVVVWAPSEEQVGQHQVSLRVSDGRGGSATQSFVITVDETNSAPVITSRPITTATAGLPYEYRLLAQDADGDELSFRVDAAPAGMTIERVELRNAAAQVVERFFQLRWAVPVGAAGTNPTVTVVAADGRGGEAMQTWTLNVAAANAVNGAPTIASLPPTTARLGLEWIYRVEAKDPNGDPLGYALLQKPAGMQVNASGVLSWPVPVDAPATVPVELQVSDGRGGQATQKFDLRITAIERNNTPTITSVPRQQSVTGQTYAYDPVGRDPDGDPLRWSLTSAPRGMSIDPATGNIRWTPDDLQLGAHLVAITATDPFLAQFTQRFELYVGCNNIAPAIVSIPPTTALTGRTYLYPVRAEDLEGDTLAWQLTTAPAGMAIDAKTGVIRWTPTAAQIANHDVVIAVTDGINTATQRYSIVVSNSDELVDANDPAKGTKGNRPPLITSTPKFVGEVGSLYTYQVTALDPDGDNVTISLGGTLPTGMTVNSTGLIAWIPAASSVGDFVINVVATDTHGAISTQGYLLSITVNAAPQINSTPVTNATSGSVYRYTVRATDPDGDPLTYRLATAPTGMTIDRFGRILWPSSFGDTQPQNVAVTVSDGRGKSSTQSWQITMQPDSESPKVSLSVVAGNQRFFGDVSLDVGTQYTIQFDPTDNVEVMSIALFKDGVSTGLSNPIFPRSVTFTGGVEGIFHFRATATDAAGLTGENTLTVTIGDPAATNLPEPTNPTLPPHPGFVPGDTGVPIVIITSPEPASTVSNLVPIIGTVDDPEDNLWYYRVYYARADKVSLTNLDEKDPDWVILKESTQEVIDGELAVFDPSILSNDPYALIVAAYDVNGRGFIQPTILYVEGNVQIGNFRLEFTDLSIPLAGIPIQVNRVYDTVTAGDEGDFGYGWSLGVQDARLLEVAAVGPGGALNGGNDKFIPDKTKVYLTNPSGQRVGFTYKEQLISASFFGGIWRPYFQADPGVYDTLTIDETQVARGGIVGALAQGINPNAYSLTTKDGLKYRYSKTNGLQTITDLNGNVVTFSDTGIQHSSGASIGFVRDHRGRITAIVDPAGNVIRYTYNAAGDLVKLTNQVGLETRYEYLANPAHYLDQAFDSLGKRALKAVYEQNASTKQFDFKGIIDAAGNRVGVGSYELGNKSYRRQTPSGIRLNT
ncbi:MAG: putative Ig domain-containing protein [Pirellulaceae bacterium]|nr:putative Ig domain-containing protein [Pirellulaceae bacterium]